MPDRAYLHQLIDAIPEQLLEHAQRLLEFQGISSASPGTLPQATVKAIQQRLRDHVLQASQPDTWDTLREKMRQGNEATVRRRHQIMGNAVLAPPDGASSHVQGRDADGALLLLTFRYFKGQKLEATERLSVSPDGRSLFYTQDLTGPDGTHSRHEAQFAIR